MNYKNFLLIVFLAWSFCGAVITIENQTGEPDKDIFFLKKGKLIYSGEEYTARMNGLILEKSSFSGNVIKVIGYSLRVRNEPKNLNGVSMLPVHILEDGRTYILSKMVGHYFLRKREWR